MAELSGKRKVVFYTELAKLTEAGFGIKEAARVMKDSGIPRQERKVLDRMLATLEEGKSIGDSFGSAGVSKLEQTLITAGEKSGKPAPAFEHLASYFQLFTESRRQALQGMIYPLVLLHLGLLLASIPVGLGEGGLDVNALAIRFVSSLVVMYAVLIGGFFLMKRLLSKAPEDEGIDGWLGRIPVMGKARRAMAMARYTRVFHAALLAGLPMRETVTMSGEASQSARIAAASGRLAAVVKEGGAIGPAMVTERAFPKEFSRSYVTAEESGSLDEDMERWAKKFSFEASDRVQRFAALLPKIGYALIVIFVVWKIFAFASGYYGMLEELGA